MKRMKFSIFVAISLAMSFPAYAAMDAMPGTGPHNGAPHLASKSGAASFMAQGRINSIDRSHAMINITHGPIRALHWPGMTMSFGVRKRSLLNGLRAGQAVGFDLAHGQDGSFVISRIAPAK